MAESADEASRKEFEAKLAEERAALEKAQADRRAEFEAQLAAKKKQATAEQPVPQQQQQQQPPEGCTGQPSSACSTCAMKDSCGSSKQRAEQLATQQEIGFRMQFINHKLLILSGKGGVGKSMVSSQLAFALARRGFQVGLLDIDICGPTVPKMVGKRGAAVMRESAGLTPVRVSENLVAMSIGFIVDDENEAVIWRGPRKLGLIQMFLRDVNWGPLDFLLVDTPPGTSDEHISIVQMLANAGMDGAVVVTSPQDVSVIEVGKEINFCERMHVPCLGVIENFASFACPLCSGVTDIWPATSGGGMRLATDHHVPFLGRVPLDPQLARAGEKGQALMPGDTPSAHAIESITEKLLVGMNALC